MSMMSSVQSQSMLQLSLMLQLQSSQEILAALKDLILIRRTALRDFRSMSLPREVDTRDWD
jgi:hypothetical protein